jgi:hypothetical protein
MAPNSSNTESHADFYLADDGCCAFCGVPQSIAPELVGWVNEKETRCYWIRQPQTPDEIDRAIKILHTQELGCHRYAGNDPEILKRLPPAECDDIAPQMALHRRVVIEPSGAPLHFSLSASARQAGFLQRLWRKLIH